MCVCWLEFVELGAAPRLIGERRPRRIFVGRVIAVSAVGSSGRDGFEALSVGEMGQGQQRDDRDSDQLKNSSLPG